MMRIAAIVAATGVAAGAALSPATAQTARVHNVDEDRYAALEVDEGWLRQNLRTGAIELCWPELGWWFCEPIPENSDRTAVFEEDIARLKSAVAERREPTSSNPSKVVRVPASVVPRVAEAPAVAARPPTPAVTGSTARPEPKPEPTIAAPAAEAPRPAPPAAPRAVAPPTVVAAAPPAAPEPPPPASPATAPAVVPPPVVAVAPPPPPAMTTPVPEKTPVAAVPAPEVKVATPESSLPQRTAEVQLPSPEIVPPAAGNSAAHAPTILVSAWSAVERAWQNLVALMRRLQSGARAER